MVRADAWGVAEGYESGDGRLHDAPAETVAAILAAMHATEDGPPSRGPLVVHPGDPVRLEGPAVLTTEDGGEVELGGAAGLPADLPFGYHWLSDPESGRRIRLIVSPGACDPPPARQWGWAVQLYATRSSRSWGMGDLADLRTLGSWSAGELGAGLVLLNPLHASLPGLPQTASPYYPSSRRYRNPLYLRVEEVPGATDPGLGLDLERVAADGRALNARGLIDRDAVHELKMGVLERVWARFGGDPAFDAFCDREGGSLEGYATFCALAEELGRPWTAWPAEYQRPDSPAVTGYRSTHRGRVRFHMWLQWLVDVQLERAAGAVPLIHDLAVGVDPAGADAWLWQDVFARGISVGAPPDEFNTQGQDWGLPPFDPWELRAADYEPFIETVRAGVRHAGGMRLDHVMGLFRLFWVPRGATAKEGTYVRYPAADLLDIVALESHRAGAYVVGEDLGTVQDHVREDLAARNVLSYRLLWFELEPPDRWPVKALAAVTTHDLPTVAGLWTGSDVKAQQEAGMEPNLEATEETRARLRKATGVAGDALPEEVVEGAYRVLARAPCLLLTATLDDALAVEERPNMPGTVDQWPNWSIALPLPLEDVQLHPGPARIAEHLARGG